MPHTPRGYRSVGGPPRFSWNEGVMKSLRNLGEITGLAHRDPPRQERTENEKREEEERETELLLNWDVPF